MTTASEHITAVALGNPSNLSRLHPRHLSKDGLLMDHTSVHQDDVDVDEDTFNGYNSGHTCFVYKADDERYDTGFFIFVYYSKNATEADCVENAALGKEGHLNEMIFLNQVLPRIDELLPVTRIHLRTVNGSIIISPKDRPEYSKPPTDNTLLPIPDTLASVPRVLISQLRKCDKDIFHFNVDFVTIAGGSDDSWYAFKRYRIPFDEEDQPTSMLLSEVELLNGLQSPYIIRPAFLVTDDSNSVFRGYLTPFMPAGTLANVFNGLALKDGIPDPVDDESEDPWPRVLLRPKVPHESSPEVSRKDVWGKPFVSKLSWPVKHTWSVDAANGVVALHDYGTCCGDIQLHNILLSRDGHLQLIDVAPIIPEAYTEQYMPPEFGLVFGQVDAKLPMTEARDVFAFGIVLWQIAEEVNRFDREDPLASPCLVWAEGQDSTPQWYRDLVDSCLETDVDKRPTARHILEVLTARL